MTDLIAQGPASGQRWRREVPDPASGIEVTIGRSEADWNVPWDGLISRAHVRLLATDSERVEVRRCPNARNPVFHRGQSEDEFTLVPGDHFVIGRTTFTLAHRPAALESSDRDGLTEHAYDHLTLQRRHFRDAASRIEMLGRLPDLITSSGSDEELLVRVAATLLQATPSASAVAVVAVGAPSSMLADPGPVNRDPAPLAAKVDRAAKTDDEPEGSVHGSPHPTSASSPTPAALQGEPVEVLHYDSRQPGTEDPPISARLVRSAISKCESVLYLWAGNRPETSDFTASEDVDWAFCVPLRSDACRGWALYVTGQLACQPGVDLSQSLQAAPLDLQDDVKFAELVGTTIANVRQSRRLERRQAAMRRFFAPVVMDALAGRDTDQVLAPRETDLSVLFCDLRGFSRQSERDADQLLDLLARVSDALGVMTRHILETGGVIGDFHGDAAMGFWGWPLEQIDREMRAAEAAMRIRRDYAARAGDSSFRCGLGIASGRAVAGRIGTVDQVKVTAFGPVVNLASRLEGITKAFGAEVILDEATAAALRPRLNQPGSSLRLRRLARVLPAGLGQPVEISELLSVGPEEGQTLSDHQIGEYEASLEALIRGDWNEAYERLHALPAWDRPKDVLISTILQHHRTPPKSWSGVIELPKS